MHSVKDKNLMISYTSLGRWRCEPLWLTSWNRSQPFSRRLRIEVFVPEATLEVKIDSHLRDNRRENISNTPCKLHDLRESIVSGKQDATKTNNMERQSIKTVSRSLIDRITTIDTEIDTLLDLYKDLWKK
jgi:hypothetical protein